jgi:hypothetical protein
VSVPAVQRGIPAVDGRSAAKRPSVLRKVAAATIEILDAEKDW